MEVPRLPSLFKQNRPRGFRFEPRYYDERKERLEALRQKYHGNPGAYRPQSLKGKFSQEWRQNRKGQARGSGLRPVIILAALCLITYLILFR